MKYLVIMDAGFFFKVCLLHLIEYAKIKRNVYKAKEKCRNFKARTIA
jgi:hypothetical protein